MLNLEILEQQLDRALSKENYKTTTSWLMNKRLKTNVTKKERKKK